MRTIYHTKIVSRRNIELGYFEDSDFGEITIINLSEDEATLYYSTQDENVRKFKNILLTDSLCFPFSREEESQYRKKQGRYTHKACVDLGIRLRQSRENTFSYVGSYELYQIGRRLYTTLCKRSKLSITNCGNIVFGDWWSLSVEPYHQGKGNMRFNRNNFEKELTKRKEWIKKQNKSRGKKIYFSYPRIKWHENQNNN